MLRTLSPRVRSTGFRPRLEGLEDRTLAAQGQFTIAFFSAPPMGTAPATLAIRGDLPDGSFDVQSVTSFPGTAAGSPRELDYVGKADMQTSALIKGIANGTLYQSATLTIHDSAARTIAIEQFQKVFIAGYMYINPGSTPTVSLRLVFLTAQATQINPATNQHVTTTIKTIHPMPGEGASVTALSARPTKAAKLPVDFRTVTSLNLTTTTTPPVTGLTDTFHARVHSAHGAPVGFVSFYEGTTLLGEAPVQSNGKASLTIPAVPGGAHVFAIFSGDPGSNFRPSTSVSGEAAMQQRFRSVFARSMTQDEWVLTSIWLQQGFTPATMSAIYRSLAGQTQ